MLHGFRKDLCVMVKTKCSSYPCLWLTVVTLLPILCSVGSMVYLQTSWYDVSFSPLLGNFNFNTEDPVSMYYVVMIIFMVLPAICTISFCLFKCCICCNVELIRGQRVKEQIKDYWTFIFFAITSVVEYGPLFGMHVFFGVIISHCHVSESEALSTLSNYIVPEP